MVVYDSQYQKHYKDPHWDQFAVSEYSRKLDYRIGRRSVEHLHQPWNWDSELEELSSEGSEVGHSHSSRVNERLERTGRHGRRKETRKETDVDDDERAVKIPGEAQKKHHEKQKEKQHESKRHRKQHVVVEQKERHQRHKPKRDIKTATSKSKTQTPVKKEPFLSYGWANEAPIDKKYTYNVRASPNEVYPASMRALKRRELEVKRRQYEMQRRSAVERELLMEKQFKDSQISATFLTEYQRSYCLQNDCKTSL